MHAYLKVVPARTEISRTDTFVLSKFFGIGKDKK